MPPDLEKLWSDFKDQQKAVSFFFNSHYFYAARYCVVDLEYSILVNLDRIILSLWEGSESKILSFASTQYYVEFFFYCSCARWSVFVTLVCTTLKNI